MDEIGEALRTVWPALAFLCAGVPLAALLDRSGFFEATVAALARRRPELAVGHLWVLAAVTTVVLNLDTTIVLLTPLAVRLARRAGAEVVSVALVPLLLASLASSALPVSNLTTLIVVEGRDPSVGDVLAHLGLPTLAAVGVGWLAYRRRHARTLVLPPAGEASAGERRALRIGATVVVLLLVGFVVGPDLGVDPWVVALVADVVLAVITRWVPWRHVPLLTAAGVAGLAVVVAVVVPGDAVAQLPDGSALAATVGVVAGVAVASVANNLPAALLLAGGSGPLDWAGWGWLLGLNVGAVLVPVGALANLLWWRVLRAEGERVTLRRYVSEVAPVAVPAVAAATVVLAVSAALRG
jgi:arsenical pump membrane protein